jgi:peptidoglycan/xylan/chitin deacetylase (PgdA/CDA1 family)
MPEVKESRASPRAAEHQAGLPGIILSYHRIAGAELDPWGMRVTPRMFEQQLSVVREIGDPMPLRDYVACRGSGGRSRPAIVITFDDGYVDNLTAALPVLKDFQVPATVFVSTGYTGKPYFWWEALEHVFLRPNRLPDELAVDHDSTATPWRLGAAAHYTVEQYAADCSSCKWRGVPGSRVRLYHEVYEALWPLSHGHRLGLVAAILSWAGLDASAFADERPMTEEELVTLGREALITLGGHSVDHLPLDQCSSSVQRAEIAGGQDTLQDLLGRPVDTFAYPHGRHTPEAIGILKEHGFVAACTTRPAVAGPLDDSMTLPRLTVRNWDMETFRGRLASWLSQPGLQAGTA